MTIIDGGCATKLEHEALEYVIGLDALGLGLGTNADGVRREALREVRPLLVRQAAMLRRAVALGTPVDPERPYTRPGIDEAGAATLDAQALKLDGEIDGVWVRCLERLRVVYLSSLDDDVAKK